MDAERIAELKFPAAATRLRLVRAVVHQVTEIQGCSPEVAQMVVLAVNEACMNAIQHAYQGDPRGEIVLKMLNKGRQLIFHVRDFGSPVQLEKIKPRDLNDLRPGGLGIHFIREIMDDYRVSAAPDGEGNLHYMVKTVR